MRSSASMRALLRASLSSSARLFIQAPVVVRAVLGLSAADFVLRGVITGEILFDDLIVRLSSDCPWRDHPRGQGCGAQFSDQTTPAAGHASGWGRRGARGRSKKRVGRALSCCANILRGAGQTQNVLKSSGVTRRRICSSSFFCQAPAACPVPRSAWGIPMPQGQPACHLAQPGSPFAGRVSPNSGHKGIALHAIRFPGVPLMIAVSPTLTPLGADPIRSAGSYGLAGELMFADPGFYSVACFERAARSAGLVPAARKSAPESGRGSSRART